MPGGFAISNDPLPLLSLAVPMIRLLGAYCKVGKKAIPYRKMALLMPGSGRMLETLFRKVVDQLKQKLLSKMNNAKVPERPSSMQKKRLRSPVNADDTTWRQYECGALVPTDTRHKPQYICIPVLWSRSREVRR